MSAHVDKMSSYICWRIDRAKPVRNWDPLVLFWSTPAADPNWLNEYAGGLFHSEPWRWYWCHCTGTDQNHWSSAESRWIASIYCYWFSSLSSISTEFSTISSSMHCRVLQHDSVVSRCLRPSRTWCRQFLKPSSIFCSQCCDLLLCDLS